ncbi:MAG: hypothetical protein ACYC7D_15935 [Nitrososphaerales archaeon]
MPTSDLKRKSQRKLSDVLKEKNYSEIYVNVGSGYLPVVQQALNEVARTIPVIYADKHTFGMKASSMKDWMIKIG